MAAASATSASIAALVGGTVQGDDTIPLSGVASLAEAGAGDISFLGNPKYRDEVLPSAAGVVLVPPDFSLPPPAGRAWIFCEDPSGAFSKVVAHFAPEPVSYEPGIHPKALVHAEATVSGSAHIGPFAVISKGARVGAHSVVTAGCFIGEQSSIGEHCLLHPNVTIRERCRIGNRVIIHPGSVIGSDGFGYESGPSGHRKIPQVGIVQIDDDVEIGAQVAVDRARFGRTWIKQGVKVDNLVQIAHNVVIGEHSLVIAQVGISGSTHIGQGVILAGQAGLAGHIRIGNRAIVMAQSGISKDLADGAVVFGSPAVDRRQYAKQQSNLKRLDRALDELRDLRKTVAELKAAVQQNT